LFLRNTLFQSDVMHAYCMDYPITKLICLCRSHAIICTHCGCSNWFHLYWRRFL